MTKKFHNNSVKIFTDTIINHKMYAEKGDANEKIRQNLLALRSANDKLSVACNFVKAILKP